MKHCFSLTIAFLLGAVLLAGTAGSAGAQATGSLELHKRVCPAGTTGNIFDECHDILPEQEVAFSVDGGPSQSVDASGNTVFTGLDAGTYAVSETEGPPLDFVTLVVYCSVGGDGTSAVQVPTDGPNFSVEVGDGEAVICDVYNVAEDLSGLTPTPAPAETSVALPNTGSGPEGPQESVAGMTGIAALLIAAAVGLLAVTRRLFAFDRSGPRH